jgi:TatD DNase family protein
MVFIDTHTHLFLPEFDNDRKQVIEDAILRGVDKMLLPNVDSTTVSGLFDVCRQYPQNCFPMIGLHPTSVKESYMADLQHIESVLKIEKVIAIGEIGIDLYWDKTYLKQQQEAFIYQINLAKQYDLPIVIHARESFNEIFDILKLQLDKKLKGVFHAFTGDIKQAEQIIEWGFKLGIGGIVTFKNSGLDKIVEQIDLNHIVLETDSPYLPPVPYRGKRNESAYIVKVAEKIAQIKNCSVEEVAEKTTLNAKSLFNL